jgi:hypothetical protein
MMRTALTLWIVFLSGVSGALGSPPQEDAEPPLEPDTKVLRELKKILVDADHANKNDPLWLGYLQLEKKDGEGRKKLRKDLAEKLAKSKNKQRALDALIAKMKRDLVPDNLDAELVSEIKAATKGADNAGKSLPWPFCVLFGCDPDDDK